MPEPTHQSIYCGTASRLRSILLKPFAKRCVQRLVPSPGDHSRLLDQAFIRAQSNVLHTVLVYTILVYLRRKYYGAMVPLLPTVPLPHR
jgi:hypothetical protein